MTLLQKILAPASNELYKLDGFYRMQTRRQQSLIRDFRLRRIVHRAKGGGKSRPHSRHKPGRSVELFSAGETVRETGIYEVIHDRGHRNVHEVVMLSADSFPACDSCGNQVRFRLIRSAPYIFQDEDFAEPE